MGIFRVGKNFSDACPSCLPCGTGWGINLIDQNKFSSADIIYAVYETMCDGSTAPMTPFIWKRFDGTNWNEIFRYTPDKSYTQMVWSDIYSFGAGYYEVTYSSFMRRFSIDEPYPEPIPPTPCPSLSTITVIPS